MSASDISFDHAKEIEEALRYSASPEFSTSKLQNDIKMLEEGAFSDCVVICRDQTWNTHKVILSRCPYFARAFSSSSGFKEANESKITIENFEPFEVSWLLQYIYGLRIDVEQSRSTSPNKSFLETCALLWSIGDFFLLPDMSQSVQTHSRARCTGFIRQSRFASIMLKEISFLPELEAGIRAAWRHDRVASPMRQDLISICVGIHSFVKDHASFVSLLDEIPEFTAHYVKALLGCPETPITRDCVSCGRKYCFVCFKIIYDDYGRQATDQFFIRYVNPEDKLLRIFCSMDCWNKLL